MNGIAENVPIKKKKPTSFYGHKIYGVLEYLCGGIVYYAQIVATPTSKSPAFNNLHRFLATLKYYTLGHF